MGLLINGQWQDKWYDTSKSQGEFVREATKFHHWVTVDGSAGPTGEGGFKAESGRFHLYVSLACPWAHRTLIFRKIKKLEDIISISIVHPHMLENGWEYPANSSGLGTADGVNGYRYHYELYTKTIPDYSGRVTVPVLWDKKKNIIVNNESAEIIRMLNSAFNSFTDCEKDFYPFELHDEIDSINQVVYENINNGVYRCGFATSQKAYENAYDHLFRTLDEVEVRLSRQRYLTGKVLTEADWRLFTTLIRFDAVYYSHFKCNRQRISDFPNLSNYIRDLYQYPGVAETVDFEQIKQHYYFSHYTINPTRIVPKGPMLDFHQAHDRSRFDSEKK